MSDFKDTLAHFGVKGMRWGQRKATSSVKTSHGSDAERKQQRRNTYKTLVIVGATIAFGLLADHGPQLASKIHEKAETNRGRAAIPALMSKAADLKYSKKRGGVYKVTTL